MSLRLTLLVVFLLSIIQFFSAQAFAASYTYNDTTSGSIPDGDSACVSPLTRTINVADSFTIGDLNVGVVINHSYKSDLLISLTSPSGTVSNIILNEGGGNADFNVLLDDQEITTLGAINHNAFATYPQFTRYPSSILSVFNGENAAGNWTLSMCDQFTADTGTFYRFQLDFIDQVGGGFSPPDDMPATGTVINSYAAVSSIAGTTIGVDTTTGFSAGDTALLIQMKGATVDRTDSGTHGDISSYGAAGRFEFVDIASIGGSSVTLNSTPSIAFNTAGIVQLVRVASYTDQTISGTIAATPWNGSKGGVIAIDATGTLTLSGILDVTGLGFMGGALATEIPFDSCASDIINYTGPAQDGVGNKGEGIVVDNALHGARRGHNANGGGGGNITDAGGGGGANYGAGGIGGRELDLCDDDGHFGGLGGQALDYTPLNRVFMGGGGGSGSEISQAATGGPRTGGGIVVVRANNLISSGGRILTNGLTANNDDVNGADGGGAAGSVAIAVNNGISGTLSIEAQGGDGGSEYNTSYAHGTGGGGGGGAILLNGAVCSDVNWTADEGKAGISQQGTLFGDDTWGAADGQPGNCFGNQAYPPALVTSLDYGDAPTTGTSPNGGATNNYGNASHAITSGIQLGSNIDDESSSQSSANADGDDTDGTDDDDGISAFPTLTAGDSSYSVNASATNTTGANATLHAWIDFDGNGSFDADEHTSSTVNTGTNNGTVALSWSGLSDVTAGSTFARFRLTTKTLTSANPATATSDGEVEDYALTISGSVVPNTIPIVPGAPALNCPSIINNGDFESETDGTYFGANRSGASTLNNWVSTGGGTDTYARIVSGGGAIDGLSAYFGNGGVRSVSPALTGGFTFDADGGATNVPSVIEIRGPADDVGSVAGGTAGTTSDCCDYGNQAVVISQDFATTSGATYRTRFTVKGEGGNGAAGIVKVDAPGGFAHVEVPGSAGERSYVVEFTASATTSTISFTNYGHIYQDNGGFCDPTNSGYCTVNGLGSGGQTSEVTLDNVEVAPVSCANAKDYGDAPTSGTAPNRTSTNAYGIAAHSITSGLHLGATAPDTDSANQPSYNARGDGSDEDGAPDSSVSAYQPVFPLFKETDSNYTTPITVTNTTGGAATLFGWIDFDGNGVFDADEGTSVAVANGTSLGSVSLTWNTIPSGVNVATTFMRLRLTTDSSITTSTPTGNANNGEVEDFTFGIAHTIPPDSPSVNVINEPTPQACQTVLFEDTFNDLSFMKIGEEYTGSSPIRDWSFTGGGADTYAVISHTDATNRAVYFGNGAIRQILPSFYTANPTFDANGRLIETIEAISLRDNPDDVSPGSSSDSGADWGPEPVKLSRDFTTVAGKTYRIYVRLLPESGTKVPGIMRVDTPAGSVHTKIPASSETSGISYAIEFTATGTTSNIGFVNYGHINSAQNEWCDQTAEQWCTVGGLGGTAIDTNELMLDNIMLAEADCLTPGTPGRAAPVVDLNGEALGGIIAGWSHHTPTSTLNADFTFSDPHTPDFGTLSFSGADPSVVNTSASTAETLGSSVTRTFVGDNTVMQVSGVTQSTYTDAKGAEDYVEYTITTTGSLSSDAVIDQLGYGTHQTNGGSNPATAPYKFTVEVSDDNFITSDILVLDKQVAANSGTYEFLTYDVADYKLSPSTTYTFRVYLYDDDNGDGDVIWDDFAISVVDDPTDYNNTFTQGGAAVDIADAATAVEDADDTNMTSASIVLTNAFAGDFFVINGTDTSNGSTGTVNGLSYTVTESGGQITIALSGSGTKATYATTISQIQFDSSAAPIDTTDRIINVTTNDGTYGSNTAVSTIDIIATAAPFTCSTDLYLTAGDPAKMYSLDLSNAIVGQNEIVSSFSVSPLNATAYNTADNYIYTIERFAPHNLVRIHSDGTSAVLGAITGFDPATAVIAGDFNAATGTLVVVTNGPTHLYEVNITTRTATLPGPYIGGPPDIAYNTADGKFYGVNGSGEIHSYDPTNSYSATLEGNLPTAGNHGATFFDSNGMFYVLHNDSQTLYSYNLNTDAWTAIGTGIGATNHNDGTSCNTAAPPIPTGTISGNVYEDTDGGDDFDNGTESGIGSVTVSLYFDNGTPGNTADDTLVSTRETAADGSYSFTDVNASAGITYRVEVDETDTDLGGQPSGTTNPVESVAVTSGGTTTVDFGFDPMPTFTCDGTLYVITGVPSIIREVNFTATGAAYNDLGSAGTRLNAGWGYNVLDNFIYGIPENTKDLYRIDANGAFTNLATISALPAGGGNAGTVLPNGELLTKLGDDSWTAIDLTAQPYASTRAFNLSGDAVGLTIYDVAYNPLDGLLYTVATNLDMITIDPATGVGTKIGTSTVFLDAAWFDANGQLYGYNNGLNQYYSIAANGAATLLANNDVDDGSATDGAGCRGGTPLPIGTLAGTVYEDSDLSDTFNSGTETGIPSVTVSLYFDNGTPGNTADDTLAATTQTAADGSYSFNAVNARADRSYRIEVDEADTDLGGLLSGTTNPVESVIVTDGGTTTVDFGFDASLDYSDTPLTGTSYGSASHRITAGIILGSGISAENAAYDSANADGDTNDDGIDISNITFTQGTTATITATTSGAGGYLQGWIDFDGNGTFDAGEQIATDYQDGGTGDKLATNGLLRFTVPVPAGATLNQTFARFRWSTTAGLDATTAANDGEVEDYALTIQPSGIVVSGRVYNDANADGINDAAEIGISNLPVVLYDTINGTCTSTRTDGGGNYRFTGVLPSTYQVYEASRETVPTPQNCDPAQARDPSGYLSTTDSVSTTLPVINTDVTGIDFGNALFPNFAPDNASTVLPGNITFYPHVFTAPTTGSVLFSHVADAPTSWSSLMYHDNDCNGDLSTAEANTDLSAPLVTVAGTDLCILHKVFAPSSASAGQQSIVTITADFTYGDGSTQATNQVLRNEDITTVTSNPVSGEGKLELIKTVENLTQGTAATESQNNAHPGDILLYRITYRNTGTAALTDVDVSDTVPAFTLLDSGSVACPSTPTMLNCVPNAANDPDISWNFTGQLEAGAEGFVTYRVTIE